MLDRDERGHAEVSRLEKALPGRLYLLERRELENYLLVPRGLPAAIRAKHRDNAPIVEKVDAATLEEVERLIATTAESLYGLVLLKRVRAELEGLRGGLLTREIAYELASGAKSPDLARLSLRGSNPGCANICLVWTFLPSLTRREPPWNGNGPARTCT